MSANIVDTRDALVKLVDDIVSAAPKPFIFVDVEGIDLSRLGSISIIQILLPPAPVVHLVDVFLLQGHAFDTVGTMGKTLKDLLESDQYVKVFFDVRNDSDALFSHFGVKLNGVIDLQIVEYASRPRAGKFIKGLAKCVSETSNMSRNERCEWELAKEAGQKLFAPGRGGTFAVLNKRPLPEELKVYCIQDVMVLPKLLSGYAAKLQPHMAVQVLEESQKRISQSQGISFNGKGSHMAVAPSLRWDRLTTSPALKFPLDVLCSTTLSTYCTIQDVKCALPRQDETSRHVPEQPGSSTTFSMSLPQDWKTETLRRSFLDEEEDNDDDWWKTSSDPWEESSERDYTACSSSSCGYCGHCDY